MNIAIQYIFILLAYLLGAIPFGYILTRYYTGKNIMEMGSCNVGSTNVGRVAGKRIAIITQLLDMLKGLIPVAVYLYFIDGEKMGAEFSVCSVGLATIIGHDFSIFLKFKGGKGVNTTLGASLLIAPFSVFISVAVYFVVKWRLKYVSLGSIILGITLPLTELFIHGLSSIFYYLLVCMILIILRHRTNINRLLHSEELSS
ncbi:glycerol-3-phosphate 1-O-acyltransferase [Ancylomarina euxinus]|uniref:Glycerol-3-phosphate acyltransferase n=1 Tax=Ancylomarina euxinus TaxID=2283627 RepID=A0A425Y4B9_9BACT|nr:glycerol-3-phosphate 1-O-acyltransferase PlsY [Ancylomarina euxinus]MCZ4694676.1 glycerol-3-phosphate 1-O-acyltransferase PlsY [Ancylomarina euxinus]MUP14220.1 glycerol-3-phosphate 1-O-acyltransferase PlsY [Ancylomarina euxinus]RRG23072.1 glycerol-3-phosphate 1-O-acyltransferase [Ancylomarina euxinus]